MVIKKLSKVEEKPFTSSLNICTEVPISTFIYLLAIYTYIPTIGLPIWPQQKTGGPIPRIYKSLADVYEIGNWEQGRAV
jgi:hypothetical protein